MTDADLSNLSPDDAMDLLAAALAKVLEAAAGPTGIAGMDAEAALRYLRRLRDCTADLGRLDNDLERHVYLIGRHGKQVLDGVGGVSVYRTDARERWDERGVAQAVVDVRMGERGGEIPDDPWEVAEWLLEVFGIGYVRKTALRSLGIPREPFYSSEVGRPKVQFDT